MGDAGPRTGGGSNPVRRLIELGHRTADPATRWLGPVALLVLRLPVAVVFWRSGRAKVEGWNIFSVTDSQYFLFREEFRMPMPELTAHVTAIAEHVLPALLVLGLFSRLSALGMFVMTMVIQFFVFPDAWLGQHMFWAALLFAAMALGPGPISLDRVLFTRRGGTAMEMKTVRRFYSWCGQHGWKISFSILMIAFMPFWPVFMLWLWTCKPERSLFVAGVVGPDSLSMRHSLPRRWHVGHVLNLIVCIFVIIGMVLGALALFGVAAFRWGNLGVL